MIIQKNTMSQIKLRGTSLRLRQGIEALRALPGFSRSGYGDPSLGSGIDIPWSQTAVG